MHIMLFLLWLANSIFYFIADEGKESKFYIAAAIFLVAYIFYKP